MPEDPEHITRIERTKHGDDVVYTKEIIEPRQQTKKKILFGLETKDFFDLLIKIAGLTTIILAWLNYTNAIHDKKLVQFEKEQKNKSDSIKALQTKQKELAIQFHDSLQQLKENNREDTSLKLKQLQLDFEEEKNRNDLEIQRQQFEQQWLNTFKAEQAQKVEERNRIFAQTQLDFYLQVTNCTSTLIDNLTYENLDLSYNIKLDELILKAKLLNRDSLYNYLVLFRAINDEATNYYRLINLVDSIETQLQSVSDIACGRNAITETSYSITDTVNIGAYSATFLKIKKFCNKFLEQTNANTVLMTDTAFKRKSSQIGSLAEVVAINFNVINTAISAAKVINGINKFSKPVSRSNGKSNQLDFNSMLEDMKAAAAKTAAKADKTTIDEVMNKLQGSICNEIYNLNKIHFIQLEDIKPILSEHERNTIYKLQAHSFLIQEYMNHSNILLSAQ